MSEYMSTPQIWPFQVLQLWAQEIDRTTLASKNIRKQATNVIDRKTKIFFLTPDLEDNSLGRTYVLWLLAQELGMESIVVSTRGEKIWDPLSNDVFASSCRIIDNREEILSIANEYDIIVTIQPLEESLILGDYISSKIKKPMIADIDDPDLVSILAPHRLVKSSAKWVLKTPKMLDALRRLRLAREYPTIVSNPVLQKYHGGTIISHARLPLEVGARHQSHNPHVVFVGTNRPHKGINLLRQAISELHSDSNFRLTVTDVEPPDAKPWENWVGQLPFTTAMDLVRSADIVALPSLEISYGQLPAKLIDAMLAGRAVLASAVEPIPWALNGRGLVIPMNNVAAIKEGLMQLRDPALREFLGDKARAHAMEEFTVASNAPTFYKVIQDAIQNYHK